MLLLLSTLIIALHFSFDQARIQGGRAGLPPPPPSKKNKRERRGGKKKGKEEIKGRKKERKKKGREFQLRFFPLTRCKSRGGGGTGVVIGGGGIKFKRGLYIIP